MEFPNQPPCRSLPPRPRHPNGLIKLLSACAMLVPAKLFACATCYANGADINDPMVDGANWAILTLGVVVVTVLGTFITFFVYILRKSATLAAAAQNKTTPDVVAYNSLKSAKA